MRQQVNLYQAVLIDKREPLRARQVGLILLLFIALLTVLSLLGYRQTGGASQRLAALQKQQTAKIATITALEEQYPQRQKNALLEEEIQRSRDLLEEQKQLLGYFSVREEAGNDGILQLLDGLARNQRQGVWLRRIQLADGGRNIALDGSAVRPELVPQYLESLGEKGVLAGQVFSRLKLARLQEQPGQVDFSLESLPVGQP